jgi:16S rRNA (guanine(1405)-N(7))-methyltransferase
MITQEYLEKIVAAVQSADGYMHIRPEMVRWLADEEAAKGRNFKDTVKAVRSRLHQVGGAYLPKRIDYQRYSAEISTLPRDRHDELIKAYCRKLMALHASTRERLPILEQIFQQVLLPLGEIHSILDLGCGLNPLAIPWMPVHEDCVYLGYDIYQDMVDFLNSFREHLQIKGNFSTCDLARQIPSHYAQVAYCLKILPCLEQLDQDISRRLLDEISADHILVSFPVRSLGGHVRGMLRTYREHFEQLVKGKSWQIRNFEFDTELVFCISR